MGMPTQRTPTFPPPHKEVRWSSQPPTWRTRAVQFLDQRIFVLLVLPAFLVLFLTTVGPFLGGLWFSFTNFNLGAKETEFVGLQTYRFVLTNPSTQNAILRSFYLVFAAVGLEMVLGMGLALLLARPIRGIHLVRTAVLLPLMTTPAVAALAWRMLFNTRFGYVNYFLGLLGLPQLDWLGSPSLGMPALILADIWATTPFVASLLLAGLLSLPEEPLEAAVVDGASAWQRFWHITLPLLRPVMALTVMFRITDAFRKFESVLILTGGGPGEVTTIINFLAYNVGFYFLRMADACVMAVILVLLMLIAVFFCLKWLQQNEEA